jgi:hypothetical protein
VEEFEKLNMAMTMMMMTCEDYPYSVFGIMNGLPDM